MSKQTFVVWLVMLFLVPAVYLTAADLKSDTIRAWDIYLRHAEMRVEEHSQGQRPFLRLDETGLSERVRRGEIVVEPEDTESPHRVPRGLIHDWVGAVFVPNASLDEVVGLLNEYERYKEIYRPMVAESRLLQQGSNRQLIRLIMIQKAFHVTAAIESDDEVHFIRVDPNRAYSFSSSLRVQEIADYGKPTQHAFPEDHGPGFVWRNFTVTRLEQRDGGTYAEMEMIALSRGIPWAFRWLVEPLTERLPQTILTAMLSDTRDAVIENMKAASLKPAVMAQSR